MLKTLQRWYRRFVIAAFLLFLLLVGGFCLPENTVNPVKDAHPNDWHPRSFWYYPWGVSGVHRGVDIFATYDQPVLAATGGIVISTAERSLGGQTLTILGPKWRLHYYAHLSRRDVHWGQFVRAGTAIGGVGTSGNASGKAPHLHYAIITLIPYVWQRDNSPYGSQKMWYINPLPRL